MVTSFARRLLASVASVAALVFATFPQAARADAYSLAVGRLDPCSKPPVLHLTFANSSDLPSTATVYWRQPMLNVAVVPKDGSPGYHTAVPLAPTAAHGSSTTDVPIDSGWIRPSYYIAITGIQSHTSVPVVIMALTTVAPIVLKCMPLPKPVPTVRPAVTTTLRTAQLRSFVRDFTKGSTLAFVAGQGGLCDHDCEEMGRWRTQPIGPQITYGSGLDAGQSYGDAIAGYAYDTAKHLLGDAEFNQYMRLAFRFDLTKLDPARPIVSATLNLHGRRSFVDFKNDARLCATQLGFGSGSWWLDPKDALDTSDFSQPLSAGSQTNSATIDVTKFVRLWQVLPAARNGGFVLRNPDENLHAFTEATCFTQYDGISLTVKQS